MNKKNIKEILSYVLILLVIILIKCFIVTTIRVNGESMYPTLKDKEIMILDRISYKFNDIKRFDIIVAKINGTRVVKRVIGLPKERVMYKESKLYINDEYIEEHFLKETTQNYLNEDQEECYIVLGDNRDNSLDSRYFGCIPKSKILGKANLVLYPFSKIRIQK